MDPNSLRIKILHIWLLDEKEVSNEALNLKQSGYDVDPSSGENTSIAYVVGTLGQRVFQCGQPNKLLLSL